MKPPFWRRDRTKKTRQVCPDPIIGTQNSKYTFLYFPKTDGVQVVRVHRPGKKTAQIKDMFFNESNVHLHQEFKREKT